MTDDTREMILAAVEDLVSDLLYYNRQYDEDLPRGVIEEAYTEGVITVGDIVNRFRRTLEEDLCV